MNIYPEFTQMNISQLAQARPSGTSAVTLLQPVDKTKIIVYSIVLANTTGGAVGASLFHDSDGTTFDQSTALLYSKSIPANDYIILEFEDGVPLNDGSALGCQTATGSAITFTVYGIQLALSGTAF